MHHAVTLRNGMQDLTHPMSDIFFNKALDKQDGKQEASQRQTQKEQVLPALVKQPGYGMMREMHQVFEQHSRQPTDQAGYEGQYQDELTIADMPDPPVSKPLKPEHDTSHRQISGLNNPIFNTFE